MPGGRNLFQPFQRLEQVLTLATGRYLFILPDQFSILEKIGLPGGEFPNVRNPKGLDDFPIDIRQKLKRQLLLLSKGLLRRYRVKGHSIYLHSLFLQLLVYVP